MSENNTVNIKFRLNGRIVETRVFPELTLLELVRREFGLTAVKEGCGRGECGACTLLFNGSPVNACLKIAATLLETDSVVTLEGLENNPLMKKIQQAYVDEGVVQCGFCIPGMVISSFAFLKQNPNPSNHQIKEAHCGNLCRCTGYGKIEKAIRKAADK